MTKTALAFAPNSVAGIESYRLNNHIAASLHYLSMSRLAHDVGLTHAAMCKASRAGEPDWFERSGADRYFRRNGHELYLRDDLYFGLQPTIFDDDLKIGFRDRA